MEHIEHLPQEIRSVVRGFCSHPIADTLRPHVVDYRLYSFTFPQPQTYPDAHTFYPYFFANKKLVNIICALKKYRLLQVQTCGYRSGHSARSCGLCMSKPFPIILKSNHLPPTPLLMRHGSLIPK